MRVLVTGASGFAGRHLVSTLVGQDHQVTAADRSADAAGHPEGVEAVALDVTDPGACWDVLHGARPDLLIHLAAVAHVAEAERDAERCHTVNVGGTANLLQACLDGHANVRTLFVSSAEVYGPVGPEGMPVTEDQPLRPGTAYAASKACAEMRCHHAVAQGLHVVIARAFNHIGPGQSEAFVASAFARQVARIEAGLQEPVLAVGNLDAVRDFSDVRATVVGYLACLEVGQPGDVFNVTSGAALSIRELLDTLLSLSEVPIRVEQDPARLRPLDVPVFHGSGARLAEACGYQPRFDARQTLGDVLDDWRQRVAAETAGSS